LSAKYETCTVPVGKESWVLACRVRKIGDVSSAKSPIMRRWRESYFFAQERT
jgi:hypothetical protein